MKISSILKADFRGKRTDNGKWIVGARLDKNNIGILHEDTETEDLHIDVFQITSETFGEYTGLTDKNGTKIFEGDIVKLPDEENPCLIEWDDDAARFVIDGDVCVDFDNYYGNDLEVVGNIHDQPELLEGVPE